MTPMRASNKIRQDSLPTLDNINPLPRNSFEVVAQPEDVAQARWRVQLKYCQLRVRLLNRSLKYMRLLRWVLATAGGSPHDRVVTADREHAARAGTLNLEHAGETIESLALGLRCFLTELLHES
jgi:hypothetical protein